MSLTDEAKNYERKVFVIVAQEILFKQLVRFKTMFGFE